MSGYRIYLPAQNNYVDDFSNVSSMEILNRYIEKEFPGVNNTSHSGRVFAVPKKFSSENLERQAFLSEQIVFERLEGLSIPGLWCVFFQGRTYGGISFRNERNGKIMIREHDFVVFTRYKGHRFASLIEVKSTCDECNVNMFKISDCKMIKNNKRSAQHQLRDHLEIIYQELKQDDSGVEKIQSYIFWPFLSGKTKDPQKRMIERWKEDGKLHVFKDTFENQQTFDDWFYQNILKSQEELFDSNWMKLLQRFIILSCGVFVEELDKGLLALLNQEQLDVLHRTSFQNGRPLIIHGAAGTGKTLLVLRKLEQLHRQGELNDENCALYICYWPGIRCDVCQKLEKLGISDYVDTARFYIAMDAFLQNNKKKYRHVFMDESEAICLAFSEQIIRHTFERIENAYDKSKNGCLWYLVDINQAAIFLPKHSPNILKDPDVVLRKVMRSTKNIYEMFNRFHSDPFPMLPPNIKETAYNRIETTEIGHEITGLPIFWSKSSETDGHLSSVTKVIIDLCTTKGIKPNDLAVFPFLVTEQFRQENVNSEIRKYFVENGFMPQALGNVENFLMNRKNYHFTVPWVLRAKGLEFKVVVLVIEDDIDFNDSEDRRKLYIMSSRCTSMLIVVCSAKVKSCIDEDNVMYEYPFGGASSWYE